MRSIERDGTTGRRVAMSLRVPAQTRDKLVSAAQASGRSLTTETEIRLSKSFEHEPLLDETLVLACGEGFAGIVLLLSTVMRDAALSRLYQKGEDGWGPSWLADADAYDAAQTAARIILEEFRPEGMANSDPRSTGERIARARIFDVVNLGAPYPVGRRQWIDRIRSLLGPDLMAQSNSMRNERANDAAIEAARTVAASDDSEAL